MNDLNTDRTCDVQSGHILELQSIQNELRNKLKQTESLLESISKGSQYTDTQRNMEPVRIAQSTAKTGSKELQQKSISQLRELNTMSNQKLNRLRQKAMNEMSGSSSDGEEKKELTEFIKIEQSFTEDSERRQRIEAIKNRVNTQSQNFDIVPHQRSQMVAKEAPARLVESKPEPKSQTAFANHFQKMI